MRAFFWNTSTQTQYPLAHPPTHCPLPPHKSWEIAQEIVAQQYDVPLGAPHDLDFLDPGHASPDDSVEYGDSDRDADGFNPAEAARAKLAGVLAGALSVMKFKKGVDINSFDACL